MLPYTIHVFPCSYLGVTSKLKIVTIATIRDHLQMAAISE